MTAAVARPRARSRLRALTAAAGLAVALAPALAAASYPAGVWGLIDKVTPSGDMNAPMVRIDGLFIVGNQLPDFADYPGYAEPRYGYMYYQCPKGQEKVCAMEWADIAAAAGSDDDCRGWGELELKDNGSVRESEPMMSADPYPIANGVFTGFSPCEALRAWMQANPDTTSTSDGTGDASTSEGTGDASTSDATGDASTGDASTGDASTGDASTGGTGDSAGTGGTGGTAGSDATGDSAGTGDTAGSGGTGDSAGSSSAAATGDSTSGGQDIKDSGCACRSGPDAAPLGLFSLLLGLGLARGRRRGA